MLRGSVAWRAYLNANRIPVVFETTSGETLTITAKDKSGNQLAVFNAPTGAVLLPDKEIRLDVTASYRLGYKRRIGPARLRVNDFTLPAFRLDDPQSHRWNLNDILWYENLDIMRNGKSANYCIVLRSDGLALIETNSGQVLWTFSEPGKTEWGLKLCRPRRIEAPRLLRTSL